MPWSTRELAEMASTTVNTIRHYHRMGLLDEPVRRHNGYKQYEVRHLVRLLRIRRLADLGVPLSQMDDLSVGAESTPDVLRALDAELQMSIERLQGARAEIVEILHHGAPADGPAGFESVASRLSEKDSSMVHIYTQFYDEDALSDIRRMAADESDDTSAEIEGLSADADEQTRAELAEKLAKTLTQNLIDYSWMSDPAAHLSKNGRDNAQTFIAAMGEMYNPAQLDVFVRAYAIADARVRAMPERSDPLDQ